MSTEDMKKAELFRRELARRHLLDCCQYVIPDFVVDNPQRILCKELEMVERGETKRLIINTPPQHGKSTILQMFGGWYLGRHPRARITYCSYDEPITLDHSQIARDRFQSKEFGRLFPGHADSTRNAKSDWGSVQGGSFYAASVKSGITGHPATVSIIDDPTKGRKEADSPVVQKEISEWFWGELYQRRSSPDTPIILVQTRWNLFDLAGQLIDAGKTKGEKWRVVALENLIDEGLPTERAQSPVRWPIEEVLNIRDTIPEREWLSQHQQRPAPSGGTIYKRDWWQGQNRYDISTGAWTNRCIARRLSYDTASETGDKNDYTALVVGELSPEYRLGIREVRRSKVEFTALLDMAIKDARRYMYDGKLRGIDIEYANSGVQLYQSLKAQAPEEIARLVTRVPAVKGNHPRSRALDASTWCVKGLVLLPKPCAEVPWLYDFEEELFTYPAATHDDMAAGFSQLVWRCRHYLSEAA